MDLQEYRNFRNKFQDNYFKIIKPQLNKFEEKRIKLYKIYKYKIFPICSFLFSFFVGRIFYLLGHDQEVVFSLPLAILCVISILIAKKVIEKTLEDEIKTSLMKTLCQSFDNLKWVKKEIYEVFHEIGLTKYYNRKYFDDILKENIKI